MIVHRAGDSALLVETGDSDRAHRLRAYLRALDVPGVRELVPGLSTLLIVVDPLAVDVDALAKTLPAAEIAGPATGKKREMVVDVVYDGPDLDRVAERTGLAPEEVIARHAKPDYRVAMLGFAPGFAYLTGLDPKLRLARLDTPRTRVPQGAVAIAGDMSVIYPCPTPGGWRILGHTQATLFDPRQNPPNRLAPGDRVRFRRRG